MYGVIDVWGSVAKPRKGSVPAGLVPRDQDDPGAHFCECDRDDLANSGRAARDDNSLSPHKGSCLSDRWNVSSICNCITPVNLDVRFTPKADISALPACSRVSAEGTGCYHPGL